MTAYQNSEPSSQEQERFDSELPAWLAGQLSDDSAAWMEDMQAKHKTLALQALWLRDARAAIRDEAASQNTDAAWALLEKRIQADSFVQPVSPRPSKEAAAREPKVARWLQWLLGHPGWANAAAAMAVVLVVGQAAWIAAGPGSGQPVVEADADTPAWRSLDLDDLQASGVRIQLRLKAQSLSTDLATIARDLSADVSAAWLAQADGSWLLQLGGKNADAQVLLAKLKAHPQVEQAQLLP